MKLRPLACAAIGIGSITAAAAAGVDTTNPATVAAFQSGLTVQTFESLAGRTPQPITAYTEGDPVSPTAFVFDQVPGVQFSVGGVVSCFFGYRLFRIVLALFGFILGALTASSVWGVSDSMPQMVAAGIGGLIGAGLMIAAYFVGVALVGAALGAVVANIIYKMTHTEPHVLGIVFASIVGAVGSTYLQRYFLIVGTGFGGAWTLIVGTMAAVGNRAGLAAVAASGSVWVPYPLDPAPGQRWVPIAWGLLGLLGTTVQLGWTGGEKGRVGRKKKKN